MTASDGFTKQQVQQLKDLFREEGNVITQNLIDYVDAKINIVRSEMSAMEGRILNGIADLMDNDINPRFDNHERRLTRLEQAKSVT